MTPTRGVTLHEVNAYGDAPCWVFMSTEPRNGGQSIVKIFAIDQAVEAPATDSVVGCVLPLDDSVPV